MLNIQTFDCGTKLAITWHSPITGKPEHIFVDLPVQVYGHLSVDLMTKDERNKLNKVEGE